MLKEIKSKLKETGLTALANEKEREIIVSPDAGHYKTLKQIREVCKGYDVKIKSYYQGVVISL